MKTKLGLQTTSLISLPLRRFRPSNTSNQNKGLISIHLSIPCRQKHCHLAAFPYTEKRVEFLQRKKNLFPYEERRWLSLSVNSSPSNDLNTTDINKIINSPANGKSYDRKKSKATFIEDARKEEIDFQNNEKLPWEIFENIIQSRFSVKQFKPNQTIDDDILISIIQSIHRTPTSYNIQPYKVVVVRSDAKKKDLAACMLGANQNRVRNACFTLVFVANLEPTTLIPKLIDLEKKRGLPEQYLAFLPYAISYMGGQGKVAELFKSSLSHLLSPLRPMPSINSTEGWIYKNTALAACTGMLSAHSYYASHRIGSCMMEGYDGERIKKVLEIPQNGWEIPMVLSVGIVEDGEEEKRWQKKNRKTTESGTEEEDEEQVIDRYPVSDIFFLDSLKTSIEVESNVDDENEL